MAADAFEAEPAWPADAVEVGRIVDAYGIKGWIKVQPFSSDPKALFSSRRWFLRAGERPMPGLPKLLRVLAARDQGEAVVASVHDVEDRNQAEALRGARVFVARSSFPTAPDDEYYWVDLIGLDVVNRDDTLLGTVAGLLDTGPHSVLRVQVPGDPAPDERLIPFVAAYVDSVDFDARRIVVDWALDY